MDISKEEEKILLEDSFRMYINEISKIPFLSKKEERELFVKLSNGDIDAKRKIIEANLRFVVFIAKRYLRKNISILDLIQEGNLGLQYAVDHFNVEREVRFLTYADYYIKKYIRLYLEKGERNIKLPIDIQNDIMTFKKIYSSLSIELGRYPTFDEIAIRMNKSVDKIKRIYFYLDDVESLNSIVDKDENDLQNLVYDSEDSPEEIILKKDLYSYFNVLLYNSGLTEREIFVLVKRFGLENNKKLTLVELSELCNLTHERVRQIEKEALEKLRHSKHLKYVENYYSGSNEVTKKKKWM